MYLIRRKSDGLVQYSFTERPRMGRFLKYPVLALDIKPDTHEIVEGNVPTGFVPGAYTFDKNGWAVSNQKAIDAISNRVIKDPRAEAIKELSQVKANQDGKQLSLAYFDKRLDAIEKILGIT